jgi:hypothetical protein
LLVGAKSVTQVEQLAEAETWALDRVELDEIESILGTLLPLRAPPGVRLRAHPAGAGG